MLVVDGGRPRAVITRTDVLAYLSANQTQASMADDAFLDANQYGFETRAIPGRAATRPGEWCRRDPVSLATTFAQPAPGEHPGVQVFMLATRLAPRLRPTLRRLKAPSMGLAFASGMAASDLVLRGLRPGDHLVLGNDAYGGTYRLIARVLAPMGITFSTVDLTSPTALSDAWTPSTKLVLARDSTNPLLTAFDIRAIADVAHANGGLCVVDSTFATPYLQQPIAHGADVVVHSTTKYLGGHSDVVGGFVTGQ
ncbi:MAG: PLP-dependent transferase [Acidimicrobiales bacterium]